MDFRTLSFEHDQNMEDDEDDDIILTAKEMKAEKEFQRGWDNAKYGEKEDK